MAKKDWFAQFAKMEGAVTEFVNPFNSGVSSTSPSANFIYGNGTWLLPYGYSEVLYGPPKGGKSVYVKMKIGQLHQDDPEAIAVVFDTEFRWKGQLTPELMKVYGIDPKRCWVIQKNSPIVVFDTIQKKIPAMIQDGAKIKYVVIDSISGVLGRREMDSESVETQQIGDHALTIQTGLKRILEPIRVNDIAVSLVAQVRAELDTNVVRRTGQKTKMNASFGLQHFAEYFVYIAAIEGKEGRRDALEREFVDTSVTDSMDKGEITGHRIRVTMSNSSMGPKRRSGEFTFDYKRGLINAHEEVFVLGVNRNIIKSEGSWLSYGGKKYHGKKDMLKVLEESPEMQASIVKALKDADLRGDFRAADASLISDAPELDEDNITAVTA